MTGLGLALLETQKTDFVASRPNYMSLPQKCAYEDKCIMNIRIPDRHQSKTLFTAQSTNADQKSLQTVLQLPLDARQATNGNRKLCF